MKKHFGLFSQYLIGVLFGLGLIISGMSNPQKILGFLDLAGLWDPSLIFVMLGAVLVGLGGFYVVRKRTEAFFGGAMHLPKRRDITKPLIIGSLIWCWLGYCWLLPRTCHRCIGSRASEGLRISGGHVGRHGNLRKILQRP